MEKEEEEGLTLERCYPREGAHSPHSTLTLELGGQKGAATVSCSPGKHSKGLNTPERTLGLPSAAVQDAKSLCLCGDCLHKLAKECHR